MMNKEYLKTIADQKLNEFNLIPLRQLLKEE